MLRSIDTSTLVGLRDRALIGVMLYTCARVSAAVGLKLGHRFEEDHVLYLILHEKGGKEHRVPCNHMLEKYLREYMQRAPFPDDPDFPLFSAFLGKSEVMTFNGKGRRQAALGAAAPVRAAVSLQLYGCGGRHPPEPRCRHQNQE